MLRLESGHRNAGDLVRCGDRAPVRQLHITLPPPCAAPEYRQLDFWVGRWDVYPTGKDKLVAHSLIEPSTAAVSARTGCRSATSQVAH